MPIAALPQTTIRAIGSTTVISDPCSVVKELIDNALDASASSLLVEISQNTVDVIQLKDNGHGIPSEDHPYVCRRTCTSKIRTVDDLRNIGGTSLGFRGEALASVAEMSGGVTITTRVQEEMAAACLKYGRNGELSGTQRTSHPVGTNVRITDFLKHVPVRRQTALKSAAKNLRRMKKLLQAYAMAQPSKRISLKILIAKNDSCNWIYAPSINATLSDAAMKVVGTEMASCCAVHESSSEPGERPSEKYRLVALLPKGDNDLSKVNNGGQFLSVDGRPLSSRTGVGQEIANLYKSFVRASASKEKPASIADPFLCLYIQCPRGSYDVNIEPAKDDVLFVDRDRVMSMIESLLCDQYGKPPSTSAKAPIINKNLVSNSAANKRGFELLMARKRPREIPMQTQPANSFINSPVSQNLHSLDASLPVESTSISPVCDDNGRPNRESDFVNPWSITRMNASFQTPRRPNNSPQSFRSPLLVTQPSTQRTEHISENQSSANDPELPSPPISRISSTSPVNRRGPRQNHEDFSSQLMSSNSRRAARERDRERYGNGALDTWFRRTTQVSLLPNPPDDASSQDATVSLLSQLVQKRFGNPETRPPQERTANEPEDVENEPELSDDDQATQPRRGEHDPDSDARQNEYLPESMNSGRGFPVLEKWAASLREGLSTESYPGLEEALDFERRKKEAIKSRRAQCRNRLHSYGAQSDSYPSQSPHRNRYLAAKAALAADHDSTESSLQLEKVGLSAHDPRTYLMRHMNEVDPGESLNAKSKARRLRTSRLPFEKITQHCGLRDICLPLPAGLARLSQAFESNLPHDRYTQCGEDVEAFSASDMASALPLWSRQLESIINQHFKTKNNSQVPDWRVDLSSVMTAHLKEFYSG